MAYVRDTVFETLFPCFQKHSHASFLMFRTLFDKGVDSIRWRGTGMVFSYIESHSPVFLFPMLLSTRSDGEARPVSPQRHRVALRTVTLVL